MYQSNDRASSLSSKQDQQKFISCSQNQSFKCRVLSKLIEPLLFLLILISLLLQVCQSWRGLASHLNFGCHLGSLEKHGGEDSGSLRLLLRLWSTAKPASYNVKGLKRVLAAEVGILS